MKLLTISLLLSAALISGCETYQNKYYDTQKSIAEENTKVANAKYEAIGKLAAGGGDTARVAGIISLMSMSQQSSQVQLAAPKSNSDTVLQYLSVLVPGAVQSYGIARNADVAINSSIMARDTAVSTNATFLGMSSNIQAPGSITTNTLSGTGSLGSGTYSIAPSPVVITPVVQVVPTVVQPTVITPVIQTPQ